MHSKGKSTVYICSCVHLRIRHYSNQIPTVRVLCWDNYFLGYVVKDCKQNPDSEIVMVDLALGDHFFEQDRSWDDFGTTISGIWGTHQNFIGFRMQVLLIFPRVDSKLDSF